MKRTYMVAGTVLVLLIAVCLLYAARMLHRGFSTRDTPSAAESSVALQMRSMAIPASYKSMKNPVATTPEVLQEGAAHWADHCATCHSNNGSGDTMYGKTMYPRPPDMRDDRTQRLSDGELYYTIQNGIRLSGMPAFGDPGDNDIASWKLVAFIRHLPKLSQEEEAGMERLNPRSPDELREEMEEEEFLNGGKPAPKANMSHMNH